MTVSIIIPIYNQEKHLRKCVDSCLKQTYHDIEIILVNDASTDRSLDICKEYLKQDNRIKLIDKKENEGVEKARFSGLGIVSGEYVTFLDSDDWFIDSKIISKAYAVAIEHNSDIVEMGMVRCFDNNGWFKRKMHRTYFGHLNLSEFYNEYFLSYFGKNILNVNMCGKMYRSSLIKEANISPFGLTMGEDEAFNLYLFPQTTIYSVLPDFGYAYRWGGITSHYNSYFYADLLKFYKLRRNFLKYHPHPSALDYLKIELKNILLTQIEMMITYRIKPEKEILNWISHEINSETYSDIAYLTHPEHLHLIHQPDIKAIVNKNAKTLYDIAYRRFSKSKKKRIFKKLLSKLF